MATTAPSIPARPRGPGRKLIYGGLALLILIALATHHASPLRAPVPHDMTAPASDPFAYWSNRNAHYADRALAGEAHPLFSASPGGALATAARVDRLRPLIDSATAGSGIDPDLLEGLVFVESAGRPDAIVGGNPANAAGLTQILPDTATSMLGLHVDLGQSQHLTQEIAAAPPGTSVAALERQRMRVDERFDPAKALAATARYLQYARARFGREDLSFVAYHMGTGNLSQVLDAYDGGRSVPYAQVFFDSAPGRHASAYALLSGLSDESALYYWRVLGAAALVRLYRSDRPALARLTALQNASTSNALVLHPPDHTTSFADASALGAAYDDGQLAPLPANPRQLGLAYGSSLGAQARRLHVPAGLYRGLTPPALDVLLELGTRVRALSHSQAPLVVTSAVTDRRYQHALTIDDPPAAGGWSFTLQRPSSAAQMQALQSLLGRLQALNLVAWTAYSSEVEVTVASDASRVLDQGP